jgi:outer membrane protein assembly factor BamB
MRGFILAMVILLVSASVDAKIGMPTFSLDAQKTSLILRHEMSAGDFCCYGKAIYLGSGGPDGKIMKVNVEDHTVLWSYAGSGYQPSYPVSNGKVVVYGTYYNPTEVICLDDSTGKKLWSVPSGRSVMSAATFCEDKVFIGSYDKYLYAIDWTTGNICWKTKLDGDIWSKPAISGDQVVIGDYAGYLYSLDRTTGKITGRVDCGGAIEGTVTVGKGLTFVCAAAEIIGGPTRHGKTDDIKLSESERSRLLVVDLKTGKVIDEFNAEPRYSFSSNVTIQDFRAFFCSDQMLYCYSLPYRKLLWQFKAPTGQQPGPIFLDNMVVLPMNRTGIEGQHEAKLCVLDPVEGKLIGEQETGGIPLGFGGSYRQCGDMVVTARDGVRFYWLRQNRIF